MPDPVTLAGLIAPQVSPDGTLLERSTVPEKWFSADTVRVDVVDTPIFAATSGVTVMVKSRNWKIAVDEWTREPLVPDNVRV
jgi:hypothetical protein